MRKCGVKSAEKDCDASDEYGRGFDDGTCACTMDNCNTFVPDKRLKCNDDYGTTPMCPAPAAGKTAACLTNRKGFGKYAFPVFRCCSSRQQPDRRNI